MSAYEIFTITSTMAGVCMAVCQIPQAWAIYKTHRTEGISFWMQVILTAGITCWFISGVIMSMFIDFISGIPMWLSNGLCMVLCIYILYEMIKNNEHKKQRHSKGGC